MDLNPNAKQAPDDDGDKLATIDRGNQCQLRIRRREYKGHRFIDLREWTLNPATSEWWPTKGKGITIKLRELEAVVSALRSVTTER